VFFRCSVAGTGPSVSTKVCSKCFVDRVCRCTVCTSGSSHREVEQTLPLLRAGDRTIGKYQSL
jgi:hypothetical protein